MVRKIYKLSLQHILVNIRLCQKMRLIRVQKMSWCPKLQPFFKIFNNLLSKGYQFLYTYFLEVPNRRWNFQPPAPPSSTGSQILGLIPHPALPRTKTPTTKSERPPLRSPCRPLPCRPRYPCPCRPSLRPRPQSRGLELADFGLKAATSPSTSPTSRPRPRQPRAQGGDLNLHDLDLDLADITTSTSMSPTSRPWPRDLDLTDLTASRRWPQRPRPWPQDSDDDGTREESCITALVGGRTREESCITSPTGARK
jgi:hypothetical protein